MKKEKKDMVLELIDHYDKGNKAQFAKRLGVSAQTISAWVARSTFDAELIYAKCESVSADWLLCGDGEMIRKSHTDSDARQAIYDLTIENTRLKKRIVELEGKKENVA